MVDDRESLPVEYAGKLAELIPLVGPALGPLAERAAGAVAREWARNHSVALAAAEHAFGRSREELEDAIATVPGVIPLTVRVLWAAGMNGYDPVLKGMGATLGDAVQKPELINEAELIVAALVDFGPSHRAVLEALEAKPADAYWGAGDVPEHVDLPRRVVGLALSGLNARGLVGGIVPTFPGSSEQMYSISELGQTVLDVLRTYERP